MYCVPSGEPGRIRLDSASRKMRRFGACTAFIIEGTRVMAQKKNAKEKRIAVTLPAGPKLEHTAERIRWAEDNGIPDGWFSDAGAPDTLTQIAALAHHTRSMRIGVAVTPVYTRT